jgi:hypothetical protein
MDIDLFKRSFNVRTYEIDRGNVICNEPRSSIIQQRCAKALKRCNKWLHVLYAQHFAVSNERLYVYLDFAAFDHSLDFIDCWSVRNLTTPVNDRIENIWPTLTDRVMSNASSEHRSKVIKQRAVIFTLRVDPQLINPPNREFEN